jgi:hypothetical protein
MKSDKDTPIKSEFYFTTARQRYVSSRNQIQLPYEINQVSYWAPIDVVNLSIWVRVQIMRHNRRDQTAPEAHSDKAAAARI